MRPQADNPPMNDRAPLQAERTALYERMRPHGLTPLWEVLHALVPPRPAVRTQPAHWRWDESRPFLAEAGRLISAEEAVRRVLILENPGWRGESRVTSSLYAGLQLILPGEVAPSHRHAQSALRFVVDGRGAWTAVDGERVTMEEGDFIITPAMAWHEHGNDGGEAVTWLDGLDIPTVAFFEAGFAENGSSARQPVARVEGDSLARYGQGLLPVEGAQRFGATSPIFSYPYARSREALAHLMRHGEPEAAHGHRLRYVNPATGGWAMPTMATWLQALPARYSTRRSRSTAGTVYSVVEGRARLTIADDRPGGASVAFELGARDHVVVPPWHWASFDAERETVLFGFSDAPLQQAAGLLRKEVEA